MVDDDPDQAKLPLSLNLAHKVSPSDTQIKYLSTKVRIFFDYC